MALLFLLSACADKQAAVFEQSLTFLNDWFSDARAGKRDDSLCHGLGTLKHPGVSCADMLSHAADIEPSSRTVENMKSLDSFADVSGEFIEVSFSSLDLAGNEVRENAVLKRDDNKLRLYWYRSDSLLAKLRAAEPEDDREGKDPLQVAYDEITARYPGLYEYPPCYGVRASSANLAGELMTRDAIDEAEVRAYAQSCPETFCFALVGNKIAPLCPQ